MALDFSKLHDAIGRVADLANAHADVTVLAATHRAELDGAQKQLDDLVEQLLAAVGSPAEKHGIAAVANALSVAPAPGVTVVAPVAPVAPITATVLPVVSPLEAPAAPAVAPALSALGVATFLPGDPRANK
ncbi:MAG: hypothetical protein ACXVCO_13735 [Ktedonobacterales bacterium]